MVTVEVAMAVGCPAMGAVTVKAGATEGGASVVVVSAAAEREVAARAAAAMAAKVAVLGPRLEVSGGCRAVVATARGAEGTGTEVATRAD